MAWRGLRRSATLTVGVKAMQGCRADEEEGGKEPESDIAIDTRDILVLLAELAHRSFHRRTRSVPGPRKLNPKAPTRGSESLLVSWAEADQLSSEQ